MSGPLLVTGAAGFIGSRLLGRLATCDHPIVAMVRPGGRALDRPLPLRVREAPVDLGDPEAVRELIEDVRPSTVFHLAATRHGGPTTLIGVNVTGTAALLDAAASSGVERVVVASSSQEYGAVPGPFREDQPCRPDTAYGAARAAADVIAAHHGRGSMAVTRLRIFYAYGPGEPEHRLIPTAFRAIEGGDVLPLTAGNHVRDLVHVDDVVDALLHADRPDSPSGVFNVCTGVPTTTLDLVDRIEALLHLPATLDVGAMEPRAWDRPDWFGDPTAATEQFGWTASIDLDHGLDGLARARTRS